MKISLFCLVLICILAVPSLMKAEESPLPTNSSPVWTVGRVEYVFVGTGQHKLKGRIDTGAGLSSIDAKVLEIKKDETGRKRVVFTVTLPSGKDVKFIRNLAGYSRIKNRHDGSYQKRPVVRMSLCVAGHHSYGRVNLANRTHMIYPVLVGRNHLKSGPLLVDSRLKFTSVSSCQKKTDNSYKIEKSDGSPKNKTTASKEDRAATIPLDHQ